MTSEEIGRHKGAVETLLHEKKELTRILQIVNSQLQRKLQQLDEAGVDTDQFMEELQEKQAKQEEQMQQKMGQKGREQASSSGQQSSGTDSKTHKEDSNLSEDMLEGEPEFEEEESSSSDSGTSEEHEESEGFERDFNPNK